MFCCANVHIFFEIQKIHQDKVVLMDFIISLLNLFFLELITQRKQ